MNKSLRLSFLVIMILSILAAACGTPAESPGIEATARPYTPQPIVDESESASDEIVANPEDGRAVFEEYCSECHDLEEGVIIEGPSLFEAGERLDYEYVKESIINPTAHLTYIDQVFEVDETTMPTDFQEWMTEQELEDVIAFVLSLQ